MEKARWRRLRLKIVGRSCRDFGWLLIKVDLLREIPARSSYEERGLLRKLQN